MTQIYTMNGILRGKNLDPGAGQIGALIERVKEGNPVGQSYGYWKDQNKILDKAIEALKDLNVGDEIQYQSSDFVIQDIWKKGSRGNGNNNGRGGGPKSPEERFSIEFQSSFSQTREALKDFLASKGTPFDGDFHVYNDIIRREALITAETIHQKAKEHGGQ